MSLRPQHALSSMAGLLGAVGLFAQAACSVTALGATDTGITQARAKAPAGAELFEGQCASCHGRHGEGLTTAPPIMGPSALPKYPRDSNTSSLNPAFATNAQVQDSTRVPGQSKRGAFNTAQDLYEYVSTRMPLPKSSAGTLKPEEYWAIVNYRLRAHGAPVPAEGISEANAKTIDIQP